MGRGTVSHISMCIFQTFQWEFGKQHPLGCQLGPPSPGVPHLVSIGLILMAVPSPPLGSALFPAVPYPSPSGLASCCHRGTKKSLLSLVLALVSLHNVRPFHLPPFQGGPTGPAASLAGPPALWPLRTCQHQAAWAP